MIRRRACCSRKACKSGRAAFIDLGAALMQPAIIGGYLGKSDMFDKAIAAFSVAYADQNEQDYEFLKKAALNGKLEVVMERE